MTRKDFDELAAHLSLARAEIVANTAPDTGERTIALATWTRCVHSVAMSARATSARFDYPHFLHACGVA
jgi:hypothetical protein